MRCAELESCCSGVWAEAAQRRGVHPSYQRRFNSMVDGQKGGWVERCRPLACPMHSMQPHACGCILGSALRPSLTVLAQGLRITLPGACIIHAHVEERRRIEAGPAAGLWWSHPPDTAGCAGQRYMAASHVLQPP